MKKHEIYVEVKNKEQAETYRKVLEAMGEQISFDYYPYDQRTKKLNFSNGWYLSREEWKSKSCVTFGELVDLLQRKPLLISEDGVELYEFDEYHAVYFEHARWDYIDRFTSLRKQSSELTDKKGTKEFSTKKAALEWIESQKPKEKKINIGCVECTITKNGISFNNSVQFLMERSITDIYKAMEELKNG